MGNDSNKREKREILVVLRSVDAGATLRQLRMLGNVTQIASPRVVILEGRAGQSEEIRGLPGVASASDEAITQINLSDLNEQEALFVAAWNLRHQVFSKKQRKGEGKAWDAEGFEPPDLPYKSKY